MSQATTSNRVQRSGIILPQEHFWSCYSRQYELPLSTICSFALHGLVFGTIVLVLFVRNLPTNVEAQEPPRMNVVEIAGGGGTDGFGGPGVGQTIPGPPNQFAKVQQPFDPLKNKPDQPELDITKIKPDPLKVNEPTIKPKTAPEDDTIFNAVISEVHEEVAKAMKLPVQQVRTGGVIGGSPGTGSGVGGGKGAGIGDKVGPGTGNSDTGVVLSKLEKRQQRWRIKFAEEGQEHLKQLKALQVTLALPTHLSGVFELVDLSGPAVQLKFSNLQQHANKIKWYNIHPPAMQSLASALSLKNTPKFAVILLPEHMEQQLAELEAAYAKGVPESAILYTLFEIRARGNGSYGPIVAEQKLKDGAN